MLPGKPHDTSTFCRYHAPLGGVEDSFYAASRFYGIGSMPRKIGSTSPKVGSTPPKIGSTPTKIGSTPPKIGSTPPKIGSTPPPGT